MKDVVNFAGLVLLMVLCGLLVSIVDSCRGYEECLRMHSMKTCKQNWGREDEIDPNEY